MDHPYPTDRSALFTRGRLNLNFELFALLGIFAALVNLIVQRRSVWILFFLAGTFLLVSIFLFEYWNLKLTASILISGWMATAMFAVTIYAEAGQHSPPRLTSNIFMLILSILSVVLVFAAYPLLNSWFISASPRLLISALSLIAVGGIMLSLSEEILRTLTGYLCVLMGFILFYSQLENSVLVVSLLSALILVFALVGSTLLMIPENGGGTE